MTLFAIFKSPLMFGGDLPSSNPFSISLLTNKAVLEVLNKSTDNRELYHDDKEVVWTAKNPNGKDIYLALFNISDTDRDITISLQKTIGMTGAYKMTDLWTHKSKTGSKNELTFPVNAHGTKFIKIRKK